MAMHAGVPVHMSTHFKSVDLHKAYLAWQRTRDCIRS